MFDREKILRIRDEHKARQLPAKMIAEAGQILDELGANAQYSFSINLDSTAILIRSPEKSILRSARIYYDGKSTWTLIGENCARILFGSWRDAMQSVLELIAAEMGDEA